MWESRFVLCIIVIRRKEVNMKFSDIDFSAISRMMDNMSDEEKSKLNNMAQNMMDNMKQNNEPEEEVDFYEALNIEEEEYSNLPGDVLDQIEAGSDLEVYYEDVKEADFSASALFYAKATLNMLRKYIYPVFKNFFDGFNNPQTTTIYSYLYPLMNQDNIHKLFDENYGTPEEWVELKDNLQQVYVLLNRAEYDFVSYEDLQMIKNILFHQQGLLKIERIIKHA